MPIHDQGYRRYGGERAAHGRAWAVIASAGIRTLLRKAFGGQDPARRAVLMMLQSAAREVPEIHAHWLAHGPLKAWQLLAGLIEDGKASGEFRRDVDSDVVARVILSGVLLQVLWQRHAPAVPGLAVDQDRLIDSATELLLAGLRANPSAVRTLK